VNKINNNFKILRILIAVLIGVVYVNSSNICWKPFPQKYMTAGNL